MNHPDQKTSTVFKNAADTDMQRNIEFVERVKRDGQTIYDAQGTPIFHTHDMELVGEVLAATGDRHYGVHMTGMRLD